MIEDLKTRKSKAELAAIWGGIGEREVRRTISYLRRDKPIIAISEAPGGYRLAMRTSDYADSKRMEMELRSRIRELNIILKQNVIFNQLVESGATDKELAAHYGYEDEL